jgi:NAD(P)H-dependent FMN reductase
VRVLGVVGSLRADSHNRRLLQAAADELAPDTELTIFENLKAVEPFDETDEHPTGGGLPGADMFITALRAADAVLFVTPEYNGSIPGGAQKRHRLGLTTNPQTSALAGKPVAVIGASTSTFGGVWAKPNCASPRTRRRRVLNEELAVPAAHQAFKDDGRLVHNATRRRLAEILQTLVTEAAPIGGIERRL